MFTVVNSDFGNQCLEVESRIENLYEILNRKPSSLGNSGFCFVLDSQGKLFGVITDSDIRKFVAKNSRLPETVLEVTNIDYVSLSPISDNIKLKREILEILQKRGLKTRVPIRVIPIVENGLLIGYVDLDQKIAEQENELEKHVVIGLGYVGTTLMVCLADNYERVVGVDKKKEIITQLDNSEPHIFEKGLTDILRKNKEKMSFLTEVRSIDRDFPTQSFIFYVCVQTPLNESGMKVSTTILEGAFEEILSKMRSGDLMMLRSTVPVGFSRRLAEFIKLRTGMEAGIDYNLCFAPERTIEGKAIEELQTLPQIIAGFTDECFDRAAKIFQRMGIFCLKAKSLEEAEICKLASNAYRDYTFAFSNFLSLLSTSHGVDVHNLIKISNYGYPRNNFPKPSPGVGGPCLSKDPLMLPENILGCESPVYHARRLNKSMPRLLSSLVLGELSQLSVKRFSVGIVGLAFKGIPETDDLRESPSLEFIKYLQESHRGLDIKVWDAVIKLNIFSEMNLEIIDDKTNVFLILNNHPQNLDFVVNHVTSELNDKIEYIFDPWDLIRENNRQDLFENLNIKISHMSDFFQGNS